MSLELISGVRNRKIASVESEREFQTGTRDTVLSFDGIEVNNENVTAMQRICQFISRNSLLRNFKLRVHKFTFQWGLVSHLSICILSLLPFAFFGKREIAILPISVWIFYNILFLIGTRLANQVIPGFSLFKHSFKASIEEFFSQKLLPVLSISFLSVVLLLSVTQQTLGGPPLCYSSCGECLASWSSSILIDSTVEYSLSDQQYRLGCGYANGKEMLGYYTMAQTSFILFITTIISMAVCMAWRVAEEEMVEIREAEEWLKKEDPLASSLRDEIMKKYGSPGSFIRPEGNALWVLHGVVAALTFTLLGWHNWYLLPPSNTATLSIILNLLTILTGTLILHLGFFGRIIALYQRNLLRVQCITNYLLEHSNTFGSSSIQLDAWWNCRNFILNDDLAVDYDTGGLAVSATFIINIMTFIVLSMQTYREGFQAIMEPPGSYCAYACLYITMCLIKIFTLATSTFEEQYRHITCLQGEMSTSSTSSSRYTRSREGLVMLDDELACLVDTLDNNNTSNSNSSSNSSSSSSSGNNYYTNLISSNAIDIEAMANFNSGGISHSMNSNSGNSSSINNISHGLDIDVEKLDILSLNTDTKSHIGAAISSPRKLHSSSSMHDDNNTSNSINNITSSSTIQLSKLIRANSAAGNMENNRQSIAEMVNQIRLYDPYPCIFGIPVMPALFATSKFYIFICFLLIGTRIMVSCLRHLQTGSVINIGSVIY